MSNIHRRAGQPLNLIHGSDYLSAVAGPLFPARTAWPRSDIGTNATFNDFVAVSAMPDGTIWGLDYLPDSSNATCQCMLPGGFEVRRVSAAGQVATWLPFQPTVLH